MTLEALFNGMTNAPYLFIGSGFSRRYCNTPNWEELLQQLAKDVRPGVQYPLKSYEAEVGLDLPREKKYPQVASRLEQEYNQRFFAGGIVPSPAQEKVDFNTSADSPFRVRLAEIFSTAKPEKLSPELQEELSDFKVAMKHGLNGIITTNYDGFLENLFNDFKPFIGQDDLIFSKAVGLGEIYKIHGCYTKPRSLVLTAEDYAGFEQRKAYLVAKLLSIFMENPIIFIGYSATDSDIHSIFTSISQCLDNEHLAQLGKRIVLIDYQPGTAKPEVQEQLIQLEKKTLAIYRVVASDFRPICKHLVKIKRSYDVQLLRRVKEDLYRTVVTNEPEDVIEVLSEHAVFDGDEASAPRRVIGFSVKGHGGHNVITNEQVYWYVLFGEGDVDLKTLVESWLPAKMRRLDYPVHGVAAAYIQKYGIPLPQEVLQFLAEHDTVGTYIPKNFKEKRKGRPFDTLEDLLAQWDNTKNGFYKILLLDESEFEKPELWPFLQDQVRKDPGLLSGPTGTLLRRLIRICDFLRNASTAPDNGCGAKNACARRALVTGRPKKAHSNGASDPETAPSAN